MKISIETDVTFLIKKLNVNGFTYDDLSTFAIDFTSYEKLAEFSEFALKSVSSIDYYNNIKNKKIDYELSSIANPQRPGFPLYFRNDLYYFNYVSLKSIGYVPYPSLGSNAITFEQNNESKIYNSDTSIADADARNIYEVGDNEPENMVCKASYSYVLGAVSGTFNKIRIRLRYELSGTITNLAMNEIIIGSNVTDYEFNGELNFDIARPIGSVIFMTITALNGAIEVQSVLDGVSYVDITRKTKIKPILSQTIITGAYINGILAGFFNGNIDTIYNENYLVSSENALIGVNNILSIKPSEFLSDYCIMTGSLLNFKLNGDASIVDISTYFNNLLNANNAVIVNDPKDISVKYNLDLNCSGLSVGSASPDNAPFLYHEEWNKILGFSQNRNSAEVLDLEIKKARVSYASLAACVDSKSEQSNKNSSNYYIWSHYGGRETSQGKIYDVFTPRDVLTKWKKFLSFAFQNFGKNTLTLSSNGGTNDNLEIGGIYQLDDLVLNETPRLLPIEYNFTCLINDVDFSENILKINHEGADVYLFVINAETTDNLSEQEIRALKIQLT